jgi:hypothetical protein
MDLFPDVPLSSIYGCIVTKLSQQFPGRHRPASRLSPIPAGLGGLDGLLLRLPMLRTKRRMFNANPLSGFEHNRWPDSRRA